MSGDIRELAIRFADLWAVDPHQMVEEIYAADIVMESMANPARVIIGSAELHDVERDLTARIPDHRHELVRVIDGGHAACLETTVVAPRTGEYAPACVWWWLDSTGKVAAEVGWFDWNARSIDSTRSHGTVPPSRGIGPQRHADWFAELAAAYAHGWSTTPSDAVFEQFHADCTCTRVGVTEGRGIAEIAAQRGSVLDAMAPATPTMTVQRIAAEGAALAILFVLDDGRSSTRGTVVLTLDAHDRIISERIYVDWSKAVTLDRANGRTTIGSPAWTLGRP